MKKILVPALLLLAATVHAQSSAGSADEILAFVRSHLPMQPVTLTGTLRVSAPNGFLKNKIPVEMDLKWGSHPPKAVYRVGEKGGKEFQTLDVTWNGSDQPVYSFSKGGKIQPDFDPATEIFETGISWGDLSFSMLWWKGGSVYGSETKKGRDCYVVDLPVPGTENTMRLWIEKKMGLLMESQTFNAQKKQIQRIKVISLKKIDDMWVVKDLDIINADSKDKTTLRIDDLKVHPEEPVP